MSTEHELYYLKNKYPLNKKPMKISVDHRTADTIKMLNGCMLVRQVLYQINPNKYRIEVIRYNAIVEKEDDNVEVVSEENGNIIRKRKKKDNPSKPKYYITKFKFYGYHNNGGFLGTFNEDYVQRFINDVQSGNVDLYEYRNDWINLKNQIESYGIIITLNNTPKYCSMAGRGNCVHEEEDGLCNYTGKCGNIVDTNPNDKIENNGKDQS